MGLQRFKSLKGAREAMVEDLIVESVNRSHKVNVDELLPRGQSYKGGLYRFKTWEEAHKFDMESMIRNSCRRKIA